jgi:hypothetical protein
MVAHTCNPSTQELRQKDNSEFKASLGYIVRPCVTPFSQDKKKKKRKGIWGAYP